MSPKLSPQLLEKESSCGVNMRSFSYIPVLRWFVRSTGLKQFRGVYTRSNFNCEGYNINALLTFKR